MSKLNLNLNQENLNTLLDLGITLKDASRFVSKALVDEADKQVYENGVKCNQTKAALLLGINRGVFRKILFENQNEKVPLILDAQNIAEIVASGETNMHSRVLFDFKAAYMNATLIRCRGNQTAVAKKLVCTRGTVRVYIGASKKREI